MKTYGIPPIQKLAFEIYHELVKLGNSWRFNHIHELLEELDQTSTRACGAYINYPKEMCG